MTLEIGGWPLALRAPMNMEGSRELEDPFCGSIEKLGSKETSCGPELAWRHVASLDSKKVLNLIRLRFF
jgi:hypothetical protein